MRIKIYQIYYKKEHEVFLDPCFIPFFNESDQNLFEIGVFNSQVPEVDWSNLDYVGFVSWKFNKKTGISGERFLSFIRDSPLADVYFINPFPELEAFSSVWDQGACSHPNLLTVAQSALNFYKIPIDTKKEMKKSSVGYCNYFVGNKYFWETYLEFMRPLFDAWSNDNFPSDLEEILKKKADKEIEADYLPFIHERLFSSLLEVKPNLCSLKYVYSLEELLLYKRKINLLMKIIPSCLFKIPGFKKLLLLGINLNCAEH